jgi:nitrogen fixation protein FixH
MADIEETTDGGKPLTGRKVFAIFAGAFALIIGVNLFMAWNAIGTFPGLETKNAYIANQTFDEERAAQEALGWQASAVVEGTSVQLTILGPDGKPARVEAVEGTIGRPTHRGDDQALAFRQNEFGVHVAEISLLDFGKWDVRFVATAVNGTPFRQRLQILLPES